jgi:hypothetical protein
MGFSMNPRLLIRMVLAELDPQNDALVVALLVYRPLLDVL